MKFAEINHKFSAIVSEYMNKGYVLNTPTMSGNQGELCKVDLTNGEEVIRVYMEETRALKKFMAGNDIRLVIGRCPSDTPCEARYGWFRQTVWMADLEVLSEEIFYNLGQNHKTGEIFYGSEEEASKAYELRKARLCNRVEERETDKEIPATGRWLDFARKVIVNRTGMKRPSVAGIKIYLRENGDRNVCTILYRNKSFKVG